MKFQFYILLLLIIITPSCIDEGMSDCNVSSPSYSIYFSYKGDGEKEIFLEKIENINIYAFDENENLVQSFILHKSDFNNKQNIDLNLPNGNYDLVCWANIGGHTQINMDTRIDKCLVGSPSYFRRDIITTNDSLYFGRQYIQISKIKNKTDTVILKTKHRKMQVMVDGLENVSKSTRAVVSPYTIEVGNLQPAVTFNQIYLQDKVSYYPLLSYNPSSNLFIGNFNILPFQDNNDIELKLKNATTNEILHTVKLKDFMAKNKISVNGKNETKVGIRFTFTGTAIDIEPWDEEIITPEM